MSEPTRQQIKEAFKETIERWERIVEEPSYYLKSECTLCQVHEGTTTCHKYCPIRLYDSKYTVCHGTPFEDFQEDRDNAHENALAELNFLRKVYIWWMEKYDGTGVVRARKEEKKEEWVDVTRELDWRIEFAGVGFYYVGGYYCNARVVNVDFSGVWIPCFPSDENFRVINDQEKEHPNFRILKKV